MKRIVSAVSRWHWGVVLRETNEAGVLQTRDHLRGQLCCCMGVSGCGRGLVGQRGIERFSHGAQVAVRDDGWRWRMWDDQRSAGRWPRVSTSWREVRGRKTPVLTSDAITLLLILWSSYLELRGTVLRGLFGYQPRWLAIVLKHGRS